MKSDDRSDVTIPLLAQLSMPVPSSERDRRIRHRCHVVLARRRSPLHRWSARAGNLFDIAMMTLAATYGVLVVVEATRILTQR
jgi:hypothetical protein